MNNKIQKLIESGLSEKTLKNLSEGQINQLYKRMVSEQVTPLPPKQSFRVGPEGGALPKAEKGYTIKKNQDNSITATPMESEIGEDANLDMVNDPDATKDGMGMFETEIGEGKKKKSKYNPWAICTSSVGREHKEKYDTTFKSINITLVNNIPNEISYKLEDRSRINIFFIFFLFVLFSQCQGRYYFPQNKPNSPR